MLDLQNKTIGQIAWIIANDWKKVNYAASPYLDAMMSLESVNDNFGSDSGRSIVAYFLCNANSWHGEVAKEVKKHLKALVK